MNTLAKKPSTKPPVLLPQVRVEIGSDGVLRVTIDREPYNLPPEWAHLGRDAVPRIFEDVTSRLASPFRVEVVDGGSTFTDIVTPSDQTAHRNPQPHPVARAVACEVAGVGFSPAEPVAIAVVVAHQCADADGVARLRLPPSLLANRPGLVVLLGQTSGTVAISGGTA